MRSRVRDDPAWFGSVMGTGAVATVAALNPGQFAALRGVMHVIAVVLLSVSVLAFVGLAAFGMGVSGLGAEAIARMRSPVTGAAYATIPGGINVAAVAGIQIWPNLTESAAGWTAVAVLATIGTTLNLRLTVEFFAATYEHPNVKAADISGVWFIPETVVLLGALLFSELARTGPLVAQRSLTVVGFALLGAGGVLFALTASMFVNRLVLHAYDQRSGVAAIWIMISPLAVTSLALQSVSRDAVLVGAVWSAALYETATFIAAMLWGFALWWIAAAIVITRHAGRHALTGTGTDWGYVFPLAAMVIATVTLGRYWGSALVELLGVVLSVALAVVWITVVTGSASSLSGRSRASGG